MRHSTIDLSLLHLKKASETQNHLTFSYWVPEHQGTGYFMRSECIKIVLVSYTLFTHIVSCTCISIVINVCAGYMCFMRMIERWAHCDVVECKHCRKLTAHTSIIICLVSIVIHQATVEVAILAASHRPSHSCHAHFHDYAAVLLYCHTAPFCSFRRCMQ